MRLFSLSLLVSLCLGPGTSVRAQTTVSFTGGINMTSLDLDTGNALVPNLQSVTRLSFGIAATIPASDQFGIQLGGSYSQKGGSLRVVEQGATIMSDIEMDYIELTMLAKLALSPGERVSPHLLVGPALALQSSCQVAVSARQGSASFDSSSNCDGFDLDTKDYDLGLAAGGGLDIGLTDQVDARLGLLYTLGLSDISEDGGDTLKHRALTIRAGLAFPIG